MRCSWQRSYFRWPSAAKPPHCEPVTQAAFLKFGSAARSGYNHGSPHGQSRFSAEGVLDFLSADWLHHLFATYGIWVLFAVVMLESMGVPVPGETALVTSALYAGATHRIGIFVVIAVAAAAAIVGDNLGYLVGRSVGFRLLARYGSYVGLHEARLNVGQYLFLRHGGKIVFFGRFVAILRTYAALLAGANRMPWPHFLLMNALGGAAWAALVGGSAWWFGDAVKSVAAPVGAALFAAGTGAVIAGAVFFRRHEAELEARADAALRKRRSSR